MQDISTIFERTAFWLLQKNINRAYCTWWKLFYDGISCHLLDSWHWTVSPWNQYWRPSMKTACAFLVSSLKDRSVPSIHNTSTGVPTISTSVPAFLRNVPLPTWWSWGRVKCCWAMFLLGIFRISGNISSSPEVTEAWINLKWAFACTVLTRKSRLLFEIIKDS